LTAGYDHIFIGRSAGGATTDGIRTNKYWSWSSC
jgi:hypothetical protein